MNAARPISLNAARSISDALLTAPQIPVGEATELPPAEASIQWRLAVALQGNDPARDFENTRPMWECL